VTKQHNLAVVVIITWQWSWFSHALLVRCPPNCGRNFLQHLTFMPWFIYLH